MGEVPYLKTVDEFKEALANNDRVVVDFTASWCPPCKMIAPKFQGMKADFTNIHFAKVDVDENSDVAQSEGIEAMPTFKFYKGGQKSSIKDLRGADENGLKQKLTELSKL